MLTAMSLRKFHAHQRATVTAHIIFREADGHCAFGVISHTALEIFHLPVSPFLKSTLSVELHQTPFAKQTMHNKQPLMACLAFVHSSSSQYDF